MSNTRKTQEFLSYIRTPLSKNNLNSLYVTYNIKFELCELFNDFIQSLIIKVIDTYMGDDITDEEHQLKHFEWCWEANLLDFKNENIHFYNIRELHFYLKEFIIDTYYQLTDKADIDKIKSTLTKLWDYIFSNTNNKTRSDVDTFLEVYQIFKKAL